MLNTFIYRVIAVGMILMRSLPGEFSHKLSLELLKLLNIFNLLPKLNNVHETTNLLGLRFVNKLGLAAGLDKNGDYLSSLCSLGFGFIEVGTVTPKPQLGNPKPRLFRQKKNRALINRMGFNNKGVQHLLKKLKSLKRLDTIIGVSVGKNFDTPMEKAWEDYVECIEVICPYADYIAINISSPNTENLRELETKKYFSDLVSSVKLTQKRLEETVGYVPLLIKISPDISEKNLLSLLGQLKGKEIDGLIATNTTNDHSFKKILGGLSGEPLFNKSNLILKTCRKILGPDFPIIASGGVMSKEMYQQKLDLGANLVQVYTGLIYSGPLLIDQILKEEN
jgi:dihydroorotate dehydrogenase